MWAAAAAAAAAAGTFKRKGAHAAALDAAQVVATKLELFTLMHASSVADAETPHLPLTRGKIFTYTTRRKKMRHTMIMSKSS